MQIIPFQEAQKDLAAAIRLIAERGAVEIRPENGGEGAVLVSPKDYEIIRQQKRDAFFAARAALAAEAKKNGLTEEILESLLREPE